MYMHLIYVKLIPKLLLCLHGKYISLSSFSKRTTVICLQLLTKAVLQSPV